MLSSRLKKILPQCIAGLIAALIAGTILLPILNKDYIVQNDFRTQGFWLWRFWDSSLLPNDYLIDFSQRAFWQAPVFYLVFKFASFFTDNLVFFSKIFTWLIAILTAIVNYLLFYQLRAKHALAITFSVLMLLLSFLTKDLVSSSPNSLIYLALALYMLWRLRAENLKITILLLVLLFTSPIAFWICIGSELIYGLYSYKQQFFNSKNPEFQTLSICVLTAIVFKFLVNTFSKFPLTYFSLAELRAAPEFNAGGSLPLFADNSDFFANDYFAIGINNISLLLLIFFALVISILCFGSKLIGRESYLSGNLSHLILAIFLSSTVLNILARVNFAKFGLPSDYIRASFVFLALLVVFVSIDKIFSPLFTSAKLEAIVYALLAIFTWGLLQKNYQANFVSMNAEAYRLLAQLPRNAVVGGHPLLSDLNSAALCSKRKIFIDYKRSFAFSKEELTEIRTRNEIILRMVYAKTEEEFANLAIASGVTHFLASNAFYAPDYLANPIYTEPYNALQKQLIEDNQGKKFYIEKVLEEKNEPYSLIQINIPLRDMIPELKVKKLYV